MACTEQPTKQPTELPTTAQPATEQPATEQPLAELVTMHEADMGVPPAARGAVESQKAQDDSINPYPWKPPLFQKDQ